MASFSAESSALYAVPVATGENDWQMNKGVLECNKYMLENEVNCDVTFCVGEDKKLVKAHSYVLTSRSPVFFAMLAGPMAESKTNSIEVKDIDFATFKNLMKYLYCEEASIEANSVLKLLYAAQKYMVPQLIQECTSFLSSGLRIDNVCTLLKQALFYDENSLIKNCLEFMDTRIYDVINDASFVKISQNTLLEILKRKTLIIKEIDLVRACITWATAQVSQNRDLTLRQALGPCLYQLHLPTLTIDEFSEVSKTDILTSEEEVAVYRHLARDDKPEAAPFISTPRLRSFSIVSVNLPPPRGLASTPLLLSFSVENPLTLEGILLNYDAYIAYIQKQQYISSSLIITSSEERSEGFIKPGDPIFSHNINKKVLPVAVDPPVEIKVNETINIELQNHGNPPPKLQWRDICISTILSKAIFNCLESRQSLRDVRHYRGDHSYFVVAILFSTGNV